MTDGLGTLVVAPARRAVRNIMLLGVAVSLSGCAGLGLGDMASVKKPRAETAGKIAAAATPQSELQKATQYWGKKFASNPRDAKIAVNYALNLKAMGEKRRALAVLQQASIFNGTSRPLASEYGRLALDLGQVGLAQKILARADDPSRPDWRVVSARGTALAKLGKHKQALSYFERASILAPNQSSVQNNLAMAFTMDGQPQRAEVLLRKALAGAKPSKAGRIRQNLSLVLGLQGKYDEAKTFGSSQVGQTASDANVKAIRQLVRLKPQLSPAAKANQIVQLAKAAANKPVKLAAKAKTKKRRKRVALRHRKHQPAPTTNDVKPTQVAQTGGPYVLRPTMHGAR